jgi:hypothetical protein
MCSGWIVSGLAAVWRGRLRIPEGALRFLLSMSCRASCSFCSRCRAVCFGEPYWPWFASLSLLPIAAIWLSHRRGASSNPIPLGATISAGAGLSAADRLVPARLRLGVIDLDAPPVAGTRRFRAFGARDPTSEPLGWDELRGVLESSAPRASSAGNGSRTFLFADRWSVASRLDFWSAAGLGLLAARWSESARRNRGSRSCIQATCTCARLRFPGRAQ